MTEAARVADSPLSTLRPAEPSYADRLHEVLIDIIQRLEMSSVESLSSDAGSIRGRFLECEYLLPESAIEALHPVAFMEYQRFPVTRALNRIADRAEQLGQIESAEKRLDDEKSCLADLKSQLETTRKRLEGLKHREKELEELLATVRREIVEDESAITGLSKHITDQKEAITSAEAQMADRRAAFPEEAQKSDEDDRRFLQDLDGQRLKAINILRSML